MKRHDNTEQDPDRLLEVLVEFVETTGQSIPITLLVSGTVISGYIVSAERYLEHFFNEFRNISYLSDNPTTTYDSEYVIKKFYRNYPETDVGHRSVGDDIVYQTPKYIHLKDVFLYTFPENVKQPHAWWRGKISCVDGFFLDSVEGTKM